MRDKHLNGGPLVCQATSVSESDGHTPVRDRDRVVRGQLRKGPRVSLMYVDKIQHPETGEFHLLTAETVEELEQRTAELLTDVVDHDPTEASR